MNYVYTFKYRVKGIETKFTYSFVSSTSFEEAVRIGIRKSRERHKSEKIEPVCFIARIGDEVKDNEPI